jgi:D-sedoheptulose 7-phosphate isomerase
MNDAIARATVTTYIDQIVDVLRDLDVSAVLRVCTYLRRTREAGGTVFLAGNGGSAATAAHWANDLGKAARDSTARGFRVVSLAEHVAWITALANDEGYERIFAGQLENFATAGDLLVVISASGNSPNLIAAVETARAHGAMVLGFLGFDGGALKALVDDCVWLPTPRGAYGPVEDAHAVLCHVLTACMTVGAAAMHSNAAPSAHATTPSLSVSGLP